MKNFFFLPLFLLFVPTIAMGADYYYCDCQDGSDAACTAGVDSNNGLSPDAPRQTVASARSSFISALAGDTVNFCRGGAFTQGAIGSWYNTNSTSSNRVVLSDYDAPWATGTLNRPIITMTANDSLFSLDHSGREEGYLISNLDIRCTACTHGSGSYGFRVINDTNYVTVDNVAIDGFDDAIQMSDYGGMSTHLTFSNLSITNNKRQGIQGKSYNLTIENTYFENNGGGTIYDHNIYLSGGNDVVIRGNELYRSSMDANGECHGTSLVVHGMVDTMLIEGNTIREDIGNASPYCWGIGINGGYGGAEAFDNVIIRNNTIINVGNVGIGVSACDDCLIENNTVRHQQAHGITAIAAPDMGRGDNDQPMNAVTIRNNSIFIASNNVGIKLGFEGSNHSVVSNAIHYSGTGNFRCLDTSLAAGAYRAIDNNKCFFPNTSSAEWERGSGTSPTPLGAWQGVYGMGLNSGYGDPGFRNPEQGDFTPNSDSGGMVGFGHETLSAPNDFRGKSRDVQPDAGAFEYGTFNPPGATILYID